ncbi:phage tail spike protein [Bacillus mycoides]|uniref:phage tail spike protein n=1 Tax=Bacillus mycoides TaxID=1405 RepID=UPI002E21F3A5|nr:phage tail spike protein [Bacillus mycoides]MED0888976.1 phage tail spike protein [Bacillus mycoides]MED0927828.1 phage tail spike protein [Bacillus mycoides]
MRTPSGTLHVVDFKTSQIVSNIQTKDYWDDKRHWEIKNNIDTLEFKVFDNTEHAATLMQQNLVLKEVRDGRIVPYVITETEKDSDDRSVTVYASGEWIQLAKAGIIAPQKIEGFTVNKFIELSLAGTNWKLGKTEYAGFHTMTIDEFISPLKLLKDIASLFELEIQYRAEVVGSQIVGRYVDMVKKRGQETGKEVTLGKDLVGIKRTENSQNICTALLGFVKKEGEGFITITDINDGIPYLVDSDAYQRWNERGQHKFGFYTPETEGDITPKRLMTLMKIEMAKRINTSYIYDVQAQSIGRVFGLAHELINEGDTIRIKDTGFTPKLYLEARAIVGDESFTDPTQDKYVFGDYREITDPNEELRKIYNRILSSLGNKQEMLDQLDKLVKEANETASNAKKESEAAKTLAEKVQENIKNNTVEIIEAKNPPTTGLKPNKTLWRDISNGKPGILKIWTGTAWESVVPDVESVKKETLEQVSKDIESTKTELNQKVQTVENKAKEIAGQISDVKKEVQGKVDSNFVKEQIKDKADKSGVFTKDEINNGFVGKQIYETDKNGNVKKFQDINTSITQTSEAIGQKAEKSELTKTNDGLSQLEKKTNEIISTADGTKQTLTQLKTQVDNTKVGGRNLLVKGNLEKTNSREFVKYADLAPIIDLHGLIEYTISFDIKVAVAGDVQVYMQNGNGTKYKFSKNVNATTQYERRFITVTPTVDNKTLTESWLSFYGTYESGRFITVKNVKVEKGNVPTDYSPAPEEQASVEEFTKKTVEIETTIKGINTSVSNVQNEQGKLAERVTKSEQTADGFKTSIESLTKKDNDISNKLNTVEQTVEGTKKTISDIQSDTNSLKQTTTEIKEQAGKVTEKLSSVEKKFDDMKIGGRNMLLNTAGTLKSDTGAAVSNSVNKTFQIAPDGLSMLQGQQFTTSFKARTSGYEKGTPNPWAGVEIWVKYKDGEQVWPGVRCESTVSTNQEWKIYSFTHTLKDKTIEGFHPQTLLRNVKGMIELKEWQIEIGNKATDYKPAAEDQVTTDDFTKKTTEIEKSVDGVKTTVTNVQNSQAGFDKRMTTVEQTASGLSSTVSNLNNVVSDQGKKLTDANSKIEQQAKEIGAKVAIKEVENYVAGFKIPDLKNTVNKNKEDLLAELANKLATEQYNQKMTLIDNRFTLNEKGIDLAAKKTEVYTQTQTDGKFATNAYVRDMEGRIQVTEKNILSTVKNGEIISAINQTAEKITIDVAKLAINADTMVKWLTAKGIDTNVINVNGDKITIDKNGVTVKMLDFLFEDEWGTKTTVMPKRNLIADHDFSSVPKMNIGNQNYQGFGTGYGLPWIVQGNGVVIENNTFLFNYEQMVNAVRVDTYNYPETKVKNGIHPGNSYTLSAHYRTAQINGVRVTAKPRLQVCFVTPLDEVSYKIWHEIYKDFPEPSTFYGDIRRYNFTFTVPNNYNPQEHMIVVKITAANAQISAGKTVCVSGITLVSGNYACMYNWDRAAAERADGIQPFRRIALGDANTNIGISDDGYTVDFTTNKEFKFFTNIRAVQGVNMGGNQFQGWGHIRFTDGNLGPGFYVSTPNGWKFNALG